MDNSIDTFIKQALIEDVGNGDYTSLSCIDNNQQSKAQLLAKENGILSGVEIAQRTFFIVDSTLEIEILKASGNTVNKGDVVLTVSGNAQSILKAERLVLNIMQRMSGIATFTHQTSQLIAHTKCKLLDTRKTTPGFRLFEKMAVKHGGGVNHRFGLYDMIMIKDNHIDYAGGIENALKRVEKFLSENQLNLNIEIETRNIKEVEEVLKSKVTVQRIMLDNYSPHQIVEALALIQGCCETEASGGININTIKEYAETGVDFISMGALTHSYKSLDLSLKAI
ncbi:MAG: carboxylating nicotinate-nucleotide diphosphorylase [Bacteroidia bacterium]|nr:carboxylating nicotinate-nucleotide diphosphorylase [Bacteroidia bacterium]MCZ2249666.1 carboxylating nicotinate-nucleotide diphosphorylase [Bacteroidia bacterium]